MTIPPLPPLPEPDCYAVAVPDILGTVVKYVAHSPSQVLAYGEACAAAERERWRAIAKSHMDMAAAMGAKEKARTAASILGEGMSP